MLNIPNLLTLFRLVLIPFILIAYYWPSESRFLWASGLFMLAAATDWLDGFLARKLNQTTAFGAFLDPVADKVTVAVALVVLVESYSELWSCDSQRGATARSCTCTFRTRPRGAAGCLAS